MGIIKEFKEFAVKGNMVDMAVGIIIGTAFNRVVNTLVTHIVMPPLNFMTGSIRFADKKFILKDAEFAADGTVATEEIAIGYGLLIEAFVDFLIIGCTIFVVIKLMNRFRRKAENPKDLREITPKDIELLSRLNELMEEQNALLKDKNK